MIKNLVSMYQVGAVTAVHLAAECLNELDPGEPGLALGMLPEEVLGKVRQLVEEYRPQGMSTNHGRLPTQKQVEAARAWIEESRHVQRSGSS